MPQEFELRPREPNRPSLITVDFDTLEVLSPLVSGANPNWAWGVQPWAVRLTFEENLPDCVISKSRRLHGHVMLCAGSNSKQRYHQLRTCSVGQMHIINQGHKSGARPERIKAWVHVQPKP